MKSALKLSGIFVLATAVVGEIEWGGSFSTPPGATYHWLASKVDGAYADPTMLIAIIPIETNDDASLDAAKETALALPFDSSNCVDITVSGVLTPAPSGSCWNLVFDETMFTSTFALGLVNFTEIAIFTEHFPTEFESGVHFLINIETGEEIEAVHELEPESVKDWSNVIGAAIIVNLMTLTGVFLIAPGIKQVCTFLHVNTYATIVNTFASGTLFACALFLVLFEPVHLLTPLYEDEAVAVAVWGTSILCGYLLGHVLETCLSSLGIAINIGHAHPAASINDTNANTEHGNSIALQNLAKGSLAAQNQPSINPSNESKIDATMTVKSDNDQAWLFRRNRIIISIMVGDFVHNFVDGILIAVGFLGCGKVTGWTIAGATIGHELVQEIADFQLLTGDQVALPVGKALLINFLSGTSVVIGAIVGHSVEFSDKVASVLLCVSGGVYMNIACTEAMPRALASADTLARKWLGFFSFAVGAAAIGLVLLDHEHCVPGGGEHHH